MSKPAPGFAKHPNHTIVIEPTERPVRVSFADQLVATTSSALLLRESRYDPVIYIPFDDCQRDFYVPSETETYCPFKGTASYWSLKVSDDSATGTAIDAVWEYRDPYQEVRSIKNFVAFYQRKFDIEISTE